MNGPEIKAGSPVVFMTFKEEKKRRMVKNESKCGKENETILQKKPGLGLRPQVRALKVTVYVLFILSLQLKNDVWNYETYKTKEGIRLVRTPPSGPTASNSRMLRRPDAGRGCPTRSPYPQATAPRRARAAATAVSGRGKWNKQVGGTRARESKWRQNLKINRPLGPPHPFAAAAPPSPSPRPRSPRLGSRTHPVVPRGPFKKRERESE